MSRVSNKVTMQSIGVVRSGELRGIRSEIIINPKFEKALDGLEEYSHIVVVFWMNKVARDRRVRLKVKPSYAPKNVGLRGVFATRVPGRPNPIGISAVPLISRRKNILVVDGLDAFNNTPVLDIKPFTGHALELVKKFRVPKWEKGRRHIDNYLKRA